MGGSKISLQNTGCTITEYFAGGRGRPVECYAIAGVAPLSSGGFVDPRISGGTLWSGATPVMAVYCTAVHGQLVPPEIFSIPAPPLFWRLLPERPLFPAVELIGL